MKPTLIITMVILLSTIVIAVCNDNPNANPYTGNSGTYGDSYIFILNSSCYSTTELIFPYCVSGEVETSFHKCECTEKGLAGRCVAHSSDIFYWLSVLGDSNENLREGYVSEGLVKSAISNWLDQ